MVAGAFGLSLLLTGCAGDGQSGADPEPIATESESTASTEPSATSSESATGSPGGSACEAIDVSALRAETGIELTAPTVGGTPGKREACSTSFDESAVLRIDLLPKHGSLEQDVKKGMVLGTEEPQEVTVAGEPGLMVSLSDRLTHVGLVTHVGQRLLLVVINRQDTGEELLEQMESLALAAAEQVAAGAT